MSSDNMGTTHAGSGGYAQWGRDDAQRRDGQQQQTGGAQQLQHTRKFVEQSVKTYPVTAILVAGAIG